MVSSVVMRIGLCKGRHDIVDDGVTVTQFVFEEAIESPHDFDKLYQSAHDFFKIDNCMNANLTDLFSRIQTARPKAVLLIHI